MFISVDKIRAGSLWGFVPDEAEKVHVLRVLDVSGVVFVSIHGACVNRPMCFAHRARRPRNVPRDIHRVLRVLCVLQGGKRHKKEEKEKKKHKTEDKSRAKPEGRKEEKREERKGEAKPKKKDPKGKSRRIVAEDDAPEEVQEIKAEPARMAALPRRPTLYTPGSEG